MGPHYTKKSLFIWLDTHIPASNQNYISSPREEGGGVTATAVEKMVGQDSE